MYSPINDIHTPTFEGAEALCNNANTNLELSQGMDYMRRFSYADLLSNHSEASLSDYEQQTPSPSNDYEDYMFQQHQPMLHPQLQHPLDEQKRRMSMIEQATLYSQQQQPSSYLLPTDYLNVSNTNAHAQSLLPSSLGYASTTGMNHSYYPQQQRSMSYSAGDVMSSLIPSMFDYHMTGGASTPMTLEGSDMMSFDTPSSSSSSSDPMSSSSSPTQVKLTKSGKVKQCRSRGRRVSSSPTLGCSKMFTCKQDDCGKVFKRSEHLKRHIRSIHTLEKRK
jgi:hypothetical protein